MEKITLGGGCFWCIEAVFEQVNGVVVAESGYSGGDASSANYKDVSTGRTGHAEVVQITYDPDQVDLEELLEVFWAVHDPTTLNQQGADVGTQYRSVIFYESEAQKRIIIDSIAKAQEQFDQRIVTEVLPLVDFFHAEPYHQNYYRHNPEQGYCRVVIRPKVQKLMTNFSNMLKNS